MKRSDQIRRTNRFTPLQVAVRIGLGLSTGSMLSPVAQAQGGEATYQEVCSACHGQGIANAPKFGDARRWAPLIREGQHVLTAHAWVGVRAMPPRGGKADLSLAEFARATAYMARAARGNWQDPTPAMLAKIEAEVARREQQLKAKKKP